MPYPELHARPQWRRTGIARFPVAALVDDQWWVLRINGFPDHPLWTLFIDGAPRFDLDDTPPTWGRPSVRSAPSLDPHTAEQVVAPIQGFTAYGSEVGDPCDDPVCCG
ncbi:hypothetical protein [Nocardia abscessus]|uniref:hypothetical protein n=1 Tax=Nocardia abscessus TaxID=120957 RepID=UPI0002F73122|nr:hypothetical protein [Nocardia abscessus]MCC3328943.1 hypothetical protein [Nocardia abscessus]